MAEKKIFVVGVQIGGGAPVTVQSMTTTLTRDIAATVSQIRELEVRGCDIVRVAVPDMESALAIREIKKRISIPLVADIHFDYRLAIAAVESGADKIRINPGNIGSADGVREICAACTERKIPIRVGVNGGSLGKKILAKFGGITAEAMYESAREHVLLLNEFGFDDICIAVKTSDVPLTIAAYRLINENMDYPLHIGVTEAGTEYMGIIKSAVGIGALLADGIGDTIRVSLTADPVREVDAGLAILKALGLRKSGYELISCPTCGRCGIDLILMAEEVERRLKAQNRDITVAVMGCVVNGPGEAARADFGIAGGNKEGVIFIKGQVVKKVSSERLVDELFVEIEKRGEGQV